MPPIYLDYNATTPIAREVADAMRPFLGETFGNPSSSHPYGVEAKRAVERARAQVAGLLGCGHGEIVFTSGGTESNNYAIRGVAFAPAARGAAHHHLGRGASGRQRGLSLARDPGLRRDGPAGGRVRPGGAGRPRSGPDARDGAGDGDARQQRGRYHRAHRRTGGHRPCGRGAHAHRRGPVPGQESRRHRRTRRGSALGGRSQALRTQGHRRALRAQRHGAVQAHVRCESRGGPAAGHRERAGDRRVGRRVRGRRTRPGPQLGPLPQSA